MSRSLSIRLTGLLLFVFICTGVFWLKPLTTLLTHASGSSAHAASPSLTFHQYADGPYKVQGNQIIGADGTPYIFHGIGRDGFEFSCVGGGWIDPFHLGLLGPGTTSANGTYWFANTVRLPLAQNFWLNGETGQCTAAQYQQTLKQTVDAFTALKMNVILDLQWTDADGQSKGGAEWQLADNNSVTFWQQIAPVYAGYSNVLFEALNEPHVVDGQGNENWPCWLNGCQITGDKSWVSACNCVQGPYNYAGVGLQTLVNTIRTGAPNNLVLVAGPNWGYDLSQIPSNKIAGSNIVYDTHPYPYAGKLAANWDASFGFLTSTYAVISAESGQYDCNSDYMSQLTAYFDAHSMGWVSWSWFALTGVSTQTECQYPQLVSDFIGTPLPSMGTFIYQKLLSYANQGPPPSPTPTSSPTSSPSPSPSPTPPPITGPVSPTWYFAEGRTGAGFKEYLTLENPSNNLCTVNIEYLTQPDSGAPTTKTVSATIPVQSRFTEWVDGDLGTSPTGPGISDAAIITVNTSATPSCAGIVAERPMYFTALGTTSGSDVIGMTHLGTAFYFGDLASGNQPGGGSYASFITILNPPSGQQATVTATYYANGQQVATQQLNVAAGARGTILPSQASPALPAHVAVSISSTQPVAVERPTYFSNIQGGNAGVVSGGADVVGVQSLSNDWLFAEGYTGGQFQENFVVANLDPANATANVTITLEYPDGTTKAFPITVAPSSQTIWNVNANTSEPGQSVSAEITSTGAKIVAEREMFFRYNHNANGRSLSAMGGTDVLGEIGPAASSAYSFAEGYTNVGFDEWLTVQNPTANTETINISLVNGKGTVYVTSISVNGHSRATVDVTAMVIQSVYHANDGYAGYEISMVVQSSSGPFVTERPMYYNAAGVQGGSDVIGYTGN